MTFRDKNIRMKRTRKVRKRTRTNKKQPRSCWWRQ